MKEETGTEVQELAARIAKLERQNRVWKWGGLLAIALMALSLGAGLYAQESRTYPIHARSIEAERFILTGADGRVLGRWSVTSSGGLLTLYSPDGKIIWSSVPRIEQ